MTALPRIAVNRKEAAEMLGVSEATLRRAKADGHLRAKRTSKDADGNPTGKELYSVAELTAWFEGLADA